MKINPIAYFEHLRKLLQIEREEELRQYTENIEKASIPERRQRGLTWYPVVAEQVEIGSGGQITVAFERTTHLGEPCQWQVGSMLALFANNASGKSNETLAGTIVALWKDRVKVHFAVEELPEWTENGKLGLDMTIDNISYKEMEKAIQTVATAQNNRLETLRNTLLGERKAQIDKSKFVPLLADLNISQNQAIAITLQAQEVAVIHGPPGTGKTTTLCQAIKLILQTEKQVLVSAPSNAAVDVLTERLSDMGLAVIRLGHPARISEKLLRYTLDEQLSHHPDMKTAKKWLRDAEEYRKLANKYKRSFGSAEREQRKLLLDEARKLRADAEKQEAFASDNLISKAQVITATLVGTTHKALEKRIFPIVLIDEAAQALEPACWIPIVKAHKVILAGDHCQLPPTVKSQQAISQGLAGTLFEKIISQQPESSVMLNLQYRSHEAIMGFSSAKFYKNELQPHLSVANTSLFPGNHPDNQPILWIDTAGCGYTEQQAEGTTSYYNPEEADLVAKHLSAIVEQLAYHHLQKSIAIISPYKNQVIYLQQVLKQLISDHQIEVNTIDGFQGQEKDIVYISLVRSNDSGAVGFLQDTRRMNVALTRARSKLIIVGDSSTVTQHSFYNDLLEYVSTRQGYMTAWEMM